MRFLASYTVEAWCHTGENVCTVLLFGRHTRLEVIFDGWVWLPLDKDYCTVLMGRRCPVLILHNQQLEISETYSSTHDSLFQVEYNTLYDTCIADTAIFARWRRNKIGEGTKCKILCFFTSLALMHNL